jgi:hypothetical protein
MDLASADISAAQPLAATKASKMSRRVLRPARVFGGEVFQLGSQHEATPEEQSGLSFAEPRVVRSSRTGRAIPFPRNFSVLCEIRQEEIPGVISH